MQTGEDVWYFSNTDSQLQNLIKVYALQFSAGLTVWQKRHMPRTPRFEGPRAFWLRNFLFLIPFFLESLRHQKAQGTLKVLSTTNAGPMNASSLKLTAPKTRGPYSFSAWPKTQVPKSAWLKKTRGHLDTRRKKRWAPKALKAHGQKNAYPIAVFIFLFFSCI